MPDYVSPEMTTVTAGCENGFCDSVAEHESFIDDVYSGSGWEE